MIPEDLVKHEFGAAFRDEFEALLAWRRDVRHFKTDPVPPDVVEHLLDLTCLAPSVGNAQPWRFVSVDAPARREGIIANFQKANEAALSCYAGERAELYARLKLAGLKESPRHFAVFCDEATEQGAGLGRLTMPETLRYSTVLAIHTLWLAARARGLGLGWVSIIDPEQVTATLEVPPNWRFVAYLCLGYPAENHIEPELQRKGWQSRAALCRQVLQR